MRSTFVGLLFVVAALGVRATRVSTSPAVKWAAVNFTDTVMIAGSFVSGPVVFVHDDERMARGEPCTTVHRLDAVKGAGEEIVAFHCKPRWGKAPSKFTKSTRHQPDGPPILTEYQFAGDEEAHEVPRR